MKLIDRPNVEGALRIHREIMAMREPEYTTEHYRCLQCLQRGPAALYFQREPHGETLAEPVCEDCGSPHVYEIQE